MSLGNPTRPASSLSFDHTRRVPRPWLLRHGDAQPSIQVPLHRIFP
jgi:hypothetical protein